MEDTGIVLGKAFAQAFGDRSGIARFGSFYVPMDEALAFAAVDVSGRPFLAFRANFSQERTGEYDLCLTEEFMRAFATNAGTVSYTHLAMILYYHAKARREMLCSNLNQKR